MSAIDGQLSASVKATLMPVSRMSLTNSGRGEARMARLDHVIELQPVELARKMVEEAREVVGIEFLERRELPEHGPELVAKLGEARRRGSA